LTATNTFIAAPGSKCLSLADPGGPIAALLSRLPRPLKGLATPTAPLRAGLFAGAQ
jgi:hypothetical protein